MSPEHSAEMLGVKLQQEEVCSQEKPALRAGVMEPAVPGAPGAKEHQAWLEGRAWGTLTGGPDTCPRR
jgi:hypothetical protein